MKVKELHIHSFFTSLLTLLAVSLLSCCADFDSFITTDDDDTGGDNSRYYFSMRVRTANMEKLEVDDAPTYRDGCAFEYAVDFSGKSQNVIIFFNEAYQYKGYSQLEFDRLSAQGTTTGTTDAEEVAFIGFLCHNQADKVYNMEKYGLMVLNAYNITDALDQVSDGAAIDDVLNLVDTSADTHIAGRSGNYFTMTSTAYLTKESNEWKHAILFEIDKEKIFEIREQAVINPAVVTYVERMASKFSLRMKDTDFLPDGGRAQVIVCNYVDGQPNYNNRNWTCSVSAWGISKYEPKEYYFRNIVGETAGAGTYPYSFGENLPSFFNGWNKAADHRCFWAIDPHYTGGTYPVQYRQAVDNPNINYYGKGGEPSLAYLSYNELCTDFSGLDNADGAILYSTENTFPGIRENGIWQHDLAGSELVIGAQIHINTISESEPDYDLFRNRLGIFYPSKTDFATYFITTFNNQLSSHLSMTFRYYDWSNPANNSEAATHTIAINYSNYKLYYRNQPLTPATMAALSRFTIPATIENGDGKVIPWIEGMYIARRNIDPSTHEEVGDIIRLDIDVNDFKSLIYDWIGAFDHFNKGKMVYTVPIRYKATETQVSASTYRPAVGDYGVVRNAWYSFDLQEINNLGTPIDNLSQKIIPYETSLENSIMVEIKAIDWHEFDTKVTLPGAQ